MDRRNFTQSALATLAPLALLAASAKPVKADTATPLVAWKPDDTYRNTGMEIDPDLQFEGEADGFYYVTGMLVFGPLSSQTGFRWALSASDRSFAVGRRLIRSIGDWNDFEVNETDAVADNEVDTGNYLYTFSGYLQMDGAATVGITWGARNPDNFTDAILYARSYLTATKLN